VVSEGGWKRRVCSKKGRRAHLLDHSVGNPGGSREDGSKSERGEDVHVCDKKKEEESARVTTRRDDDARGKVRRRKLTVSLSSISSDSVELDGIVRRSRSVDGGSLRPVERVLEGSLALLGRVGEREDDGERVELGHLLDDRLGESSLARRESDESSGCRR